MTESEIIKLSEKHEAKNRAENSNLPFVKKTGDQIVFWSVKPTGDYNKDCQTGRDYGALALEHMVTADFVPLLTWCIMDMPKKKDCSGIEIGFLEFFAKVAVNSELSNPSQISECYDQLAN